MNRVGLQLEQYCNKGKKYGEELKVKVWDNSTNKITLLFIIAGILLAFFVYDQFARRHFAFSSSTQRNHNRQLKNELEQLLVLNKTLSFLKNIDAGKATMDSFSESVKKMGTTSIQHSSELLSNCSTQYRLDQHNIRYTEQFINNKIKQLEQLGFKG